MDFIKKTLKVSAIGALTATLAFGVLDAKAEDAGTNITATVSNAFTLTETQALAFGTFTAKNDGTDVSTILIAPDGSAPVYGNPGDARIVEVTAGNMGIFDVTGAAPNAALDITLPSGSLTMTCGTCTAANEDFSIGTFTSDPATTATTDAAGDVTVNVGATLSTIASADAYEDGAYSVAYTVSLNY